MPRFAVLTRESSNRVFGASSTELLAAELTALGSHFAKGVSDISHVELGGLPFVCFCSPQLTQTDRFLLSNLALGRGVFELGDSALLRPLDRTPLAWFDSDLITIQRYVGKTNEQFTHLLVNLALAGSTSAHSRAASGDRVRLFDPVAGRGSTLNRGLLYGFDVGGIELDEGSVEHYRTFLTTYLKDHRVKHKASVERIRKGEHSGSAAFEVAIRPAIPEVAQHVRVVRASTDQTAGLFRGKRFDVLAGDLPYGVQHRVKGTSVARSPSELVERALGSWRSIMAPGASLAMSWNVKTLPRNELANLLTEGGFDIVEHERSFEHVVDRQITRDVIVSRLTAA